MCFQDKETILPGCILGVDRKQWWPRGKLPVFTWQGTVIVAVLLYIGLTSLHLGQILPWTQITGCSVGKNPCALSIQSIFGYHCAYELVCEWGSNKYIYHCSSYFRYSSILPGMFAKVYFCAPFHHVISPGRNWGSHRLQQVSIGFLPESVIYLKKNS